VRAEVEVAIDPSTAFVAFTDELDLWLVRGPINMHDARRASRFAFESGVGGRMVELYDNGDEPRELARVTSWEPGTRLGWQSSTDDVATEVTFEPSANGTTVRVVATIPSDGVDRGGTSWTRVVTPWFGAWCARRDRVSHERQDINRLALATYYARPAAAARWLAEVFSFTSVDVLPAGPDPLPHGDHGHPWIEFHVGNGSLMVFPLEGERPPGPQSRVPWIYVDDIEDHYERAKGGGATIVDELHDDWGLPFYVADDLEGNRWTIAAGRPSMG
jgi:uncharacterized glyoxalase superfamily protein PhnB